MLLKLIGLIVLVVVLLAGIKWLYQNVTIKIDKQNDR